MEPTDIEIAALAGTHKAPLSADNVPDKNQSHHCFSCEAPLNGLYCDACGQKNDNFRRSIFSLMAEMFSSFFSLDGRMWRTWGTLLFKPGKVAREFADGKRTAWSSPVRVFLAMSIILFGYMSFTGTQLISLDLHPSIKDGVTKPAADLTDPDYELDGGIYFFEGKKAISKRNANTDYDRLERMLLGISENGINIDMSTDGVQTEDGDTETTEQKASKPIIDNLTIGGKPVDVDEGLKKFIRIIQDPKEVNAIFYTWLPRIMFLMMPFSMFIGILFIRGRGNALMYDHLVHAAYIHAVMYFLMFIGIIISRLVTGSSVAIAIFIGMLVYLPLSLKRMFGRGWFKTIWTAYGVGFIYVLTIVFILMALLIFSMVQTLGPAAG